MAVFVWVLKVIKAVFIKLAIVELLALCVAYMVFADRAQGDYSLTDFAIDVVTTLNELGVPGMPDLPELGGLPPAPPAPGTAPRGTLAGALPQPPQGWTRRGLRGADTAALMAAGASLSDEDRRHAARVLQAFEEVTRGATPGVVATYARGEERIVAMIRHAAAEAPPPGPALTRVMAGRAPLAVHGVVFEARRAATLGQGLTALSARIAGQITVEAAGNTDMDTLVSVLAGLDVAGLNRLADTPDPGITAAKGIEVAPGLTPPEVTRSAVDPVDLAGGTPDQADAERQPTGVCVRRAGVRVCE